MLKTFDNGDDKYINWRSNNMSGFVGNTRRENAGSYYLIHKANCPRISSYGNRYPKGGFTERQYIKICSNNINELIEWGRLNRNVVQQKYCLSCRSANDVQVVKIKLNMYPDEAGIPDAHIEGAVKKVLVNSYERNQKAREICLSHWGYNCVVCDINFGKVYGKESEGFIHVHHLKQLSTIGHSYKVDPINDLCPVCPNCHAVIHLYSKVKFITDVKNMLNKTTSGGNIPNSP